MRQLTLMTSRLTVTTCQLSVEKAIAKRAAATKENIDAKHNVTALQKAILSITFNVQCLKKQTKLECS